MADKEITKGIDDLEGMPEFQCGLWYSPYVKITLERKPADLDKQIIRIRYQRVF